MFHHGLRCQCGPLRSCFLCHCAPIPTMWQHTSQIPAWSLVAVQILNICLVFGGNSGQRLRRRFQCSRATEFRHGPLGQPGLGHQVAMQLLHISLLLSLQFHLSPLSTPSFPSLHHTLPITVAHRGRGVLGCLCSSLPTASRTRAGA